MTPVIKCSIIITVFDRIKYLEEALRSVENQKVSKDLFDVLVISNIEINLSSHFNLDLKVVISDRMSLAGKVAEGILLAKNDVLTFLEDDDLYCKERILTVIEAFKKYKGLTYYHNASSHFRTAYEHEKLCSLNNNLKRKNKVLKIGDKETIRIYEKYLNKKRADFNLSSMAFRKDFLTSYVGLISNLGTRYIDSFLFFVALFKGNLIMIDDSILAGTRVHPNNASQSVKINKESSSDIKFSEDMEKVTDALSQTNIVDEMLIQKWFKIRSFDDIMKSNSISRRYALITMINLFKFYKLDFMKSDVAKKGIAYIVSPKMMRKMLVLFHST
jgi:glycosyltransferase involved in cell wall biosynthesis